MLQGHFIVEIYLVLMIQSCILFLQASYLLLQEFQSADHGLLLA